ncbi:unnamed protein product, partial [Rotaria magnacalcarata]
ILELSQRCIGCGTETGFTSWTANGKAGVCREKATCVGNTFTGLRQGAASIQCCVTN